jgi:hypothetical protein
MKALTIEERTRRILIERYEDLLSRCNAGEADIVENIGLLDAMKDCITGNAEGCREWTITPAGKLRFR